MGDQHPQREDRKVLHQKYRMTGNIDHCKFNLLISFQSNLKAEQNSDVLENRLFFFNLL
jgi:hypothetical protein